MSAVLLPPASNIHAVRPRRSKAPINTSPLNLDTLLDNISSIDRSGPLTLTATSPFLASPIIASTLLFSASKIAKNTAPATRSPTSPLVLHPVMVPTVKEKNEADVDVKLSKVLFEGQIKPIAISAYQDLLFLVRIAKWKVAYSKGEPFDRQEQLPYCECDHVEWVGSLADFIALSPVGRFDQDTVIKVFDKLIGEIWPSEGGASPTKEATRARELAKIIITAETPIGEVIGALQKAFELLCKAIDRLGGSSYSSFDSTLHAKSDFGLIIRHQPDRLVIEWSATLGATLLSAVSNVAQKLRDTDSDPSFVDYLVFHAAYEMLRSGAHLDSSEARWLGTPGFRKDTQTYVSLTDPGDGHVFGTTRKARWLKGAICHVEHLERPGNLSRCVCIGGGL